MDDEAVANFNVMEAMIDPSRVTLDAYADIKATLENFSLVIETSPTLDDYEPLIHNWHMSKNEYANELVPLIGISALCAGGKLIHSLFTMIPIDYDIRVTSLTFRASTIISSIFIFY